MEAFSILGFIMSTSALSFAIVGFVVFHKRINSLEKKLKDFDVIPEAFDSLKPTESS